MENCIDFRDFAISGNDIYASARSFNGLLKLDIERLSAEYLTGFNNTIQQSELHGSVIDTADFIYFIPSLGSTLDIYNKLNNEIRSVQIYPEDMVWHCLSAYLVGDKIILLPFLIDYIVCYDIITEEITIIKDWDSSTGRKFEAEGYFFCGSCTSRGKKLYAVSQKHDKIMVLNSEDMSIQWETIPNIEFSFSTLFDDGNEIWIAANNKPAIVRWNIQNGDTSILNEFPDRFVFDLERGIPFCGLVECKGRILAVGIRSNLSLWIDKETNKITECEIIRQNNIQPTNPNDTEDYRLVKKLTEDSLLLVSCKDSSIVIYNWKFETIQRFHFEVTRSIKAEILRTEFFICKKYGKDFIKDEGFIPLDSFLDFIELENVASKELNCQDSESQHVENQIGKKIFEVVKKQFSK